MKKHYLIVLIIAIALAVALIIVPLVLDTAEDPASEIPDASEYADRDVSGRNVAYVTMNIQGYGEIKLLLDATSAPRTVANFLTLAKSGFYDGLNFFSIQAPIGSADNEALILGGDPNTKGRAPSPDTVKGEFSTNGIENDLLIKRGVITMFRTGNNTDGATSIFFISNSDFPTIDGYYAPFGYIISGYKLMDKIISDSVLASNLYGTIQESSRPIITSITVDQDIDYSLISDIYAAPPTSNEISDMLGADNEAKRTTILTNNALVHRAYVSGEDNLVQLFGKIDGATANLLLSVEKSGKILKVKALSPTADSLVSQLSLLVGLDLSTIGAAEIPNDLKSAVNDALRNVAATHADDYASKYLYLRDTEGRETYTVEMKVQGYDTPVVILLDKTTAPITVANFISLVERGFYDGLTFHRIIKGFMIQGGSSTTVSVDPIKGEFASNGHTNDILHLRGTISMARSNAYDSASSQFFICDADSTHLDGNYAAFGYVISGMETVDAIADYATGKTDSNGNLSSSVAQPTIEYIKIIEN